VPFLDRTVRLNPALIAAGIALHQDGKIPPNTLLLDVDAFTANAHLLKDEAERHGLATYFMTKQHGRNPVAAQAITADRRASTVAVDMQCAQALTSNDIPLGHIGNLCQVPDRDLDMVIGRMRPDVMSVFSVAKAEAASAAAVRVGRDQNVLMRVRAKDDVILPGMEGGFGLDELPDAVEKIRSLPGVAIVGVTTFPAVSYTTRDPTLTPNMQTLVRGAQVLHRNGVDVKQINAPGNTAVNVIGMLAEAGATHVEPGSALSGHTPFHLVDDSLPERPGAVYITEISHFVDGRAWVFGGGFFLDDPPIPELKDFANRREALIGSDPQKAIDRRFRFIGTGPEGAGTFGGIDYHGILDAGPADGRVGDTVVFGFRTQAFATRAHIAAVAGCSTGSPRLEGVFDPQGHRLDPVTHW
jgi:predicted amino acid racemase